MNVNDFKNLLAEWADIMRENREYLIDLDSVVGDGDLGLTMGDGFAAASAAAMQSDAADIGTVAYLAGKAMSTAVPSTMGTLMASGLMYAGKVLKNRTELDNAGIAEFFGAYLEGVKARGKAEIGDKTFLDGLYPAVLSLSEDAAAGTDVREAASKAADRARIACRETIGMIAKHGRAAVHGEKSREIIDPGAAVADLMMKGYADFINKTA